MLPRNATRLLPGAALLALAATAHAQTLEVLWSTIDCGGGIAAGTTLSTASTLGQHDAGSLAGPTLASADGYWVRLTFCPGDFNRDGTVDTRDFIAFLNAWNASDPRSDANHDGLIDSRDVIAFLNAWTQPCD